MWQQLKAWVKKQKRLVSYGVGPQCQRSKAKKSTSFRFFLNEIALIFLAFAFWDVGLSMRWPFGLLAFWPFGLLVFWDVHLSMRWRFEALAFWVFGISGRWHCGVEPSYTIKNNF